MHKYHRAVMGPNHHSFVVFIVQAVMSLVLIFPEVFTSVHVVAEVDK